MNNQLRFFLSLLQTSIRGHHLSILLLFFNLVLWIVLVIVHSVEILNSLCLFVIFILFIIEYFYYLRISLDIDLFGQLQKYDDSVLLQKELEDLDSTLENLKLIPKKDITRTLNDRMQGTWKLVRKQFLIILLIGLSSLMMLALTIKVVL